MVCAVAHYHSTGSPVQQTTLLTEIGPVRLVLRVAALEQINGIERAVDGAVTPKEEAGKRHHLTATVGRERRDEQGHAHVQQHPEPPALGDEKQERDERGGEPEYDRAEPGMAHSVAQRPEEDDVQSPSQKQAACYLPDQCRC